MLTVLTYNILYGGQGREDDLQTIIASVQPNVVVLQELVDEGLLHRLAATLQAEYFFAQGPGRLHVGLISRYPIVRAERFHRPPLLRAMAEATIALPSGQQLHLWGVHLVPHLAVPFELWRVAEVRTLLHHTKRFTNDLCLLAGDFNTLVPGERVLVHALPRRLRWSVLAQGGRVHPWALAQLQRHRWVDCYRRMHPHTTGWTLPSHRPNARLDYCFTNPALAAHLHDCAIVTAPALVRTASDHLPVKATFALV
ncbi:MAG: endonuclease/exonuclease/phosphatase family protein [Chloroflexaceae bacterium]|jgi:exodeoxyribonuclease-3|nr:endonuclease/exonuclease/phosphatase family protein [Chloroflexaceae bacterium]